MFLSYPCLEDPEGSYMATVHSLAQNVRTAQTYFLKSEQYPPSDKFLWVLIARSLHALHTGTEY